MPLSSDDTACLVAALLAVNFFPVDRAYALMPAFRERGLLDPAVVGALPQEALMSAMNEAGYRRGGFLPILSFRLYALMEAVASGRLDALRALAREGKREAFAALLVSVNGFGPSTAETAWQLYRTELGGTG
ncbi:MAG: hypothetical protein V4850_31410 [Myxococcota bacterium]